VKAAADTGLVKSKHVSVDWTKVKANTSKHRAMSYERMLAEEKRAREEIDRWFREVEANDRAEDKLYGKESGWRLPPRPRRKGPNRPFRGSKAPKAPSLRRGPSPGPRPRSTSPTPSRGS